MRGQGGNRVETLEIYSKQGYRGGGESKGGKPALNAQVEQTRANSKMLILPVDKIKCVRNQVLMVDLPLPSPMAPKQKFVSKLKRARTD